MSKQADNFIDFWTFFSEVFVPLQQLELPLKKLHRDACDLLQKAVLGDLKKAFIIINVPPRVGKTKMVEALSAWMLAYFPDAQIITVSYSNELATTSVRYIQQILASPWYTQLFQTRLGSIKQSDQFTTSAGGKVYGDGVGGSLTGLGAGLKRPAGGFIVLDDPAKPEEALSRVVGEQLRFWFENTLKSRRNSSMWTPIIIVAQRLATDDLPGYVMENYPEDYALVKCSALVNGESIIPETVDTKSLLQTQAANPYAFACQYQQEPVVLGGNLIKLADFRYYDPGSPPKWEIKIMTCDTALKAKEHNDHSVIQCWGRSMKRAFLIDQIRGRWGPAELLNNARMFYAKHHRSASPMHYIAVEEAGAGVNLIAEMKKKGIPAKGIVRLTDKVSRVKAILAFQQVGMVYLPRGALWLPGFEVELASFREDGKSTKDDMVDCFADGVHLTLGKATSILSVLGRKRAA